MLKNLKKCASGMLLLAWAPLAFGTDYRVSVVANPTGWDVNTVVESDLNRFREGGQTESELSETGNQLRNQYSRLSKDGTRADATLSVESVGDVIRFGGVATWAHLSQANTPVEGEIQRMGSVEIRRSGDRVQLYVFDLLRSNTLLSPIDLAVIGGNEELISEIKAAHESRRVIVGGKEVPLYSVSLSTDDSGRTTGYTISQSAPSAFTAVTLVKEGNKWLKRNYRSADKLERMTEIESADVSPFALRVIPEGTTVSDHRDHQLGAVVYGWNGQVPAVQALATIGNRSSNLNLGLMALALGVVGGGVWMIKGGKSKSS